MNTPPGAGTPPLGPRLRRWPERHGDARLGEQAHVGSRLGRPRALRSERLDLVEVQPRQVRDVRYEAEFVVAERVLVDLSSLAREKLAEDLQDALQRN